MKILLSTVLFVVLVGCETQVADSAEEKSVQPENNVVAEVSTTFCDQLNGQTWQTIEQFDAGRSMNGMAKMHWTIGFDGGQFRWRYADVVEMGSYTCAGDDLVLSSAMKDPRASGEFDSALSQLMINEKIYVLKSE